MSKDWGPTKESFDKLLAWLDPDRDKAAQELLKIRQRLVKAYVCRGCGDASEEFLADRTIDRVMKKLEKGEVSEPFIGNRLNYILGFVENIAYEYFRERTRLEVPPSPLPARDDAEARDECLDRCRRTLKAEDSWLAIEYFRFRGREKIEHHRELADNLGLKLAGLRTRVHRILKELRPCIEACLEASQVH